jgi:phenylalanyl-tRNA synthetase alpha chain
VRSTEKGWYHGKMSFLITDDFFYSLGGIMQTTIETILKQGLKAIEEAIDLSQLTDVRNAYLAKKSPLMAIFSQLKDLSVDEKKAVGQLINDARDQLTLAFDHKKNALESLALTLQYENEKIDITEPSTQALLTPDHPFTTILNEMSDVFISLGYEVVEGPEVETDEYNFERLNIPRHHPAREMQDSLYMNEMTLLRTHTSPVQARVMESRAGQPIQVICPGKVYRRDEDDATHSHQFGQIEGLVVGEGVSLGHLKQTLLVFSRKIFGEKREIRLRPSYFPFTEPSVEIDVSCFSCAGKGCSLCKHSGWIEILGGGMVHPRVLTMNGYDANTMTGFAFGIGIERVAMLKYGIDDIRKFYQNDWRFLRQFEGI